MNTVEEKLARALEAQNSGRTNEALRLYKEAVEETAVVGLRFIAAREIAIVIARLHSGNPDSNYLKSGTAENTEFLRYAKIAVDLYPHVDPELQRHMPINDLIDLQAHFESVAARDSSMKRVAEELVSLRNRHGREKIVIPASPEEAMNFVREFNYRKQAEFSIDDLQVIGATERLANQHRDVWVLFNKQTLKNELYIDPTSALRGSNSRSGLWIALGCLSLVAFPVVWLVIYLVACFVFAAMRLSPADYFGHIMLISGLATAGLYVLILVGGFVLHGFTKR